MVAAPTGMPKLFLVRPDRKDLHRLTKEAGREREPHVSLNKRSVVYRSNRDGNEELYRCNLDGREVVRLTHNLAEDRHPNWSPDATKVVFVTKRFGNGDDIAIMDAVEGDNKPLQRLTNLGEHCSWPAWSPDGTQIAYCAFTQGQSDLYLMSSDGQNRRRLTRDRQPDVMPRWSPDGKKIAYQTERGPRNTSSIAIFDVTDSSISVLPLTEDASYPNWTPDGSEVTFIGRGNRYFPKQPQLQMYRLSDGSQRKLEFPAWGLASQSLSPLETDWIYFPLPWQTAEP